MDVDGRLYDPRSGAQGTLDRGLAMVARDLRYRKSFAHASFLQTFALV